MTPPVEIAATWLDDGVRIAVRPLAAAQGAQRWIHQIFTGLYYGWLINCVAFLPLIALQLAGGGPWSARLALFNFGLGLAAQGLVLLRNQGSVLTFTVRPDRLQVEHHLLGFRVVQDRVELAEVREIEVSDNVLRIVSRSRPPLREPLPALSPPTQRWICDQLNQVRTHGRDFLREQIAHQDASAELEALRDAAIIRRS